MQRKNSKGNILILLLYNHYIHIFISDLGYSERRNPVMMRMMTTMTTMMTMMTMEELQNRDKLVVELATIFRIRSLWANSELETRCTTS